MREYEKEKPMKGETLDSNFLKRIQRMSITNRFGQLPTIYLVHYMVHIEIDQLTLDDCYCSIARKM